MRTHKAATAQQKSQKNRGGTVLVENALVASVFGLFLAAIMEFGHAYMIIAAMNGAAFRSARYGSVEGVSTTQVKDRAMELLNSSFKGSKATVLVKDASAFDDPKTDISKINYTSLPDIELLQAEEKQLYIVRITVPYNSVALLPPFWIKNISLKSQSVMRHE